MAASEGQNALAPPEVRGARLLIVRSPYYGDIADALLTGAKAAVAAAGATCEVIDVPGALEIPQAIGIHAGRFDGYVALGCVIRGETTHYETVCLEANRGLTLLEDKGHLIGNGILTVETRAQAESRAGPDNKGGGAAEAALHLIALRRGVRDDGGGSRFAPESDFIQIAGK